MLRRTLSSTLQVTSRSVACATSKPSASFSCARASSSLHWLQAQPSCSTHRHISLSSTSRSERATVPTGEQPSTSPDKSADALNDPIGSKGTDKVAREAATVSDADAPETSESYGEEDDGHTLMSEQEKEIMAKLRKEFPGGTVAVQDVSGGCGTFFAINIESNRFKGLSKIKQHQLVNKVLADEVKTWHGMQLKTLAL